jgi:PAS domain S-box-containing protein
MLRVAVAMITGRRSIATCMLGVAVVLSVILAAGSMSAAQAAKDPGAAVSGRTIVAGVPAHWPPHYDLDAEGRPKGFAIDIIEEIADRIGAKVEYRVFQDFRSVSEAWGGGEIDIIPNSGITPERQKSALFTEPIETFAVSIFVRQGQSNIKNLGDLAGRKVSVVERNIGHRLLKDRRDLSLMVHPDLVKALFALLSGETDALVFPKPVLLQAARSIGVEDVITTLEQPVKTIERGIRVQKHRAELHATLNEAVAAFVNTPEYWAIYRKWYGAPTPFWSTQRVIFASLALILFVTVVMAWWRYRSVMRLNLRLQLSLSERKLVEDDLSQARTQLVEAIEAISEGFVLYDVDERLVICNSKYRQMHPDAAHLMVPGARFEDVVRAAVEDGRHPSAVGRTEEWIGERLAAFRRAGEARELRVSDGRWFRYSERKTRDGGTVGIRADITRLKKTEESLGQSEARFRDFATSASDWLWEMDEHLRFSFLSERFTEATGVAEERWLGKTSQEIGKLDIDDEVWRLLQDDLQHHRPFRGFVYSHAKSGGGESWFSIAATPVFDEDGQFMGYRGTGSDISLQKRTEFLLRESEQRLTAIMDHVPAALFLKDRDARYLLINKQFEDWFGVDQQAVIGKNAYDLYPEERAKVYADGDQRMLDHWQVISDNVVIPSPTGEDKHYLLTKFPIFNAGEPVGFGGVMNDVTERTMAELALRKSENRAEMASRAKSEFLANMSHELRTPLNAVIGFAEIIRSVSFGPDNTEKTREYAKDIYDSGQHLLELINDILDISKIELGSKQPIDAKVSVPKTIDSVLALIRERARDASLSIVADYNDNLPQLRVETRKLKQILLNLLSNSIKFTHPGGEVTLTVSCHQDEGYIFQVADTGIGIAPENIATALQPFGQINSDLNRIHTGTGLGLPLAREFVEAHDGTLELRSELGAGTTVTVRFPADRIVAPVTPEASPTISQLT